ncbi:hypothetical protein GQ602_006214 [Ophiocordyceps camponoti-floridani]|uniref:Uncharacterized protein n=1 Tax=Ophiocordyceps camponoti-floridani TaxID=2030778 RepID=A0A8H4Q2U1_9HYPO|nr:hypothetical protein GQ602_006214 [Ophiocordyceps camponoti-floridani]
MTTPSTHSLPEHWTELTAARQQRNLCLTALQNLQRTCTQTHHKTSLPDCPPCHAQALDLLKRRYTESPRREWFTQRRAFLHELEGLFQDVGEGRRGVEAVEARVEAEKEAWYRSELRGMLDEAERSRGELVALMVRGVGMPEGGMEAVNAFAEKVSSIINSTPTTDTTESQQLKDLYVTTFFTPTPPSLSRYLESYRNSSKPLEAIMDEIVSDISLSRANQPARHHHSGRLDELRRAKSAFELNRMQAKSRALAKRKAAAAVAARADALARLVLRRVTTNTSTPPTPAPHRKAASNINNEAHPPKTQHQPHAKPASQNPTT